MPSIDTAEKKASMIAPVARGYRVLYAPANAAGREEETE